MEAIVRQVRTSVSKLPMGGVITSAQLQHGPENRQALDKILGPVSREAGLRKIRNGVYWKPKISDLLQAELIPVEALERAIKAQYAATLHRSGQWAACQYFLAQEPAVATYDTDKRLAPIQVNDFCMRFRQVRPQRLSGISRELGELLNAIEWALAAGLDLDNAQRQFLGGLLFEFPDKQRAHALKARPPQMRTFCESVAPDGTVVRYISAWSALNIPDKHGDVADWHTQGMLRSQKLVVAGENYTASPDLTPSDLIDVSWFIDKHALNWPTHLCATTERAVCDMVYHAVFVRCAVPTIILSELLVEIDRPALSQRLHQWLATSNKQQHDNLKQWMSANEII
ncbi:MAG: hypothetical protein Q7V56_11720 [Gammaproteobacteria bacterium]|nr:hypothetical protein [Gammaproteobacteria bacterium]